MIPSYSKVYNLHHRAARDVLNLSVEVEEKVDGSQFSFGVVDGKLRCHSKGAALSLDSPQKLFAGAVSTAVSLFEDGALKEGVFFRGEAVQSPRHNVLAYSRVPKGNLVLWDVDDELGRYLQWDEKAIVAERLGIEIAPLLRPASRATLAELEELLASTESFLGGPKIEGVVLKPVDTVLDEYGKRLVAKLVSETFRETSDPRRRRADDDVSKIGETLATEARWLKAVQRLREAGTLDGSPKDIGPLMKAVNIDVEEEEKESLKDQLWDAYRKTLLHHSTRGLPDWYKRKLLDDFREENQ